LPVAKVNDVAVYWEQRGGGPRLLFCNGSGSTLETMRAVLLDPLATMFDLLAWDYRGFGQSLPLCGPYTMGDVAADALALLELVGWETCRVFGISFGGMVAQEFAVRNPERIERLALACTSPGGQGGSSFDLRVLDDLPPEERRATGLKVIDTRWDESWLESHPAERLLADRLRMGQDQQDPESTTARRAQLEARAGHDVWNRLSAISCPTLVGYGLYDGIAPVENATALASRITGCELRGYEGGHAFLAQDPTAAPAFIQFLQGTPPTERSC
jgi:3-oxoadipate enol-lactonase